MRKCVAVVLLLSALAVSSGLLAEDVDSLPRAELLKTFDAFPSERFAGVIPPSVGYVSKDGLSLIVAPARGQGGKSEVIQWNIADGSITKSMQLPNPGVADADLSENGRILALGFFNSDVLCWDLKGGKTLSLKPFENLLAKVALSPDGKFLAAINLQGEIQLLRTSATKKENAQSLGTFKTQFGALRFSGDGKLLAAVQARGTVGFWTIPEGGEQSSVAFPPATFSLVFDPRNRFLYGVSMNGRITVLDMETQKTETLISGPAFAPPFNAVLSPDGRFMATSGVLRETKKNMVVVWDLAKKRGMAQYECEGDKVFRIGFLPDGSGLVVFDKTPFVLKGER